MSFKHAYLSPIARAIPVEKMQYFDGENVQEVLNGTERIFGNFLRAPFAFLFGADDSLLTLTNQDTTLVLSPKENSFYVIYVGKVYSVESPIFASFSQQSDGIYLVSLTIDINEAASLTVSDYLSVTNIDSTGVPVALVYYYNSIVASVVDLRWRPDVFWRGCVAGLRAARNVIYKYAENFSVQHTIGDGSSNSHAQVSVNKGEFLNNNTLIQVSSGNFTSNYVQPLSPLTASVYYVDSQNRLRVLKNSTYPFLFINNAVYFNNTTAQNGLALVPNNAFFAVYIILHANPLAPIAVIAGQRTDTNLIAAVNNNTFSYNLKLPSYFRSNIVLLRKIVYHYSTAYTNTPKCRVVYASDVSEINPSNDRWLATCSYNGNANAGIYLQFFSGQDSNSAPLPLPSNCYFRVLAARCTANSTGVLGVYRNNETTPFATVTFNNSSFSRVETTVYLSADDVVKVRVVSGTLQKPHACLWLQSDI